MREFIINFLAVFGSACIAFIAYAVIDASVKDFKERRKRKCKYCGKPYGFLDNYCRKCGKPIREKIGENK